MSLKQIEGIFILRVRRILKVTLKLQEYLKTPLMERQAMHSVILNLWKKAEPEILEQDYQLAKLKTILRQQ